MIENAVVTAQAGGGHQTHQFFRFCGQSAFQIGVVVDVVEALYEKIVGLVDIGIQASARFDKAASGFAFVRHIFLGEEIGRFLSFGSRSVCGPLGPGVLRGCRHGQIVAEVYAVGLSRIGSTAIKSPAKRLA